MRKRCKILEFITENSAELYEICTRQTNTTGAEVDKHTQQKIAMAIAVCHPVFADECPLPLGVYVYNDQAHADCFLLSVEGGAAFCMSSRAAACGFTEVKVFLIGAMTEHVLGGPIYELDVPAANAEQEAKDAEQGE